MKKIVRLRKIKSKIFSRIQKPIPSKNKNQSKKALRPTKILFLKL